MSPKKKRKKEDLCLWCTCVCNYISRSVFVLVGQDEYCRSVNSVVDNRSNLIHKGYYSTCSRTESEVNNRSDLIIKVITALVQTMFMDQFAMFPSLTVVKQATWTLLINLFKFCDMIIATIDIRKKSFLSFLNLNILPYLPPSSP